MPHEFWPSHPQRRQWLRGLGAVPLLAWSATRAAPAAAPAQAVAAQRLVALGGALTEVVYALGAEGQLVGTDTTSLYPDAAIYAGLLSGDETATLPMQPRRKGYVQLVRGTVMVNGECLKAGDAAMLENETQVSLSGGQDAEVLVFDLAN